jgi:DNA-directed RNA polymerase specialized sigma24 family protein
MHGLARRTLARHPQRISDADDAVQSAFLAFWQHVRNGRVSESADRDDLWNLLAVMTVRKSLKQISRWGAEKRGGGKTVVRESEMGSPDEPFRLDRALAIMPAPEFDLYGEELLLQLTDEEREIAVLRLMGHTNREIADLRGCTERKIQRKLKLAQMRWEQAAAAPE